MVRGHWSVDAGGCSIRHYFLPYAAAHLGSVSLPPRRARLPAGLRYYRCDDGHGHW